VRFSNQERDCPLCRQVISLAKLFERVAFEPTDEELNISGDAEGFNINWEVDTTTGEGRYKAKATGKRKPRKAQVDNFSDLEDFIVDDAEPTSDHEYGSKPQHKAKGKSRAIIVSDDEEEISNKDEYANNDSEDLEDIEVAMQKLKSKSKPKSKRKNVVDSDDEEEATTSRAPRRSRVDTVSKPSMISSFLPSTKMQYMMKKLLEVAETHPDDKV